MPGSLVRSTSCPAENRPLMDRAVASADVAAWAVCRNITTICSWHGRHDVASGATWLAAATGVLMTAVSAANGQAPLPPPSSDPLAARAKGRSDAPVTVYEMSDFQCPYCRAFALTTMPLLEKEYVQTGKVRFVYINLPLTTRHANAAAAAELAMCTARQGKFWPLHDLLFQRQDAWASRKDPTPYLLALGDSAGLDHAQIGRASCR